MNDKVIVVTGASEGIGAVTAELVAKRGARGIVLAARRQDVLDQVAARIGDRALAVATDVTRRDQVERLRDRALERFGQIDVWINNAGRGIWRNVSELTDEDVDEMVAINVRSLLYGIQAVLPHFRERKRGQIMALSSGLSRLPFTPERSAYSAMKAATNTLMWCLRGELRAEYPEIKITTVIPGIVATDFGLNVRHKGPDNKQLPGAQSVDEVAAVIADAIDKPRGEVYTRPQMRDLVARYHAGEDPAVLETQPPFAR